MMTLAGSIHRFIQNRYRIRTTDALPAAADVALKGREREKERRTERTACLRSWTVARYQNSTSVCGVAPA